MIEIRTDATIYYIDDNGKEAMQSYMAVNKSNVLELAEEMAKSRKVTKVRFETNSKRITPEITLPVGQSIEWYDVKDGKIKPRSTSWG